MALGAGIPGCLLQFALACMNRMARNTTHAGLFKVGRLNESLILLMMFCFLINTAFPGGFVYFKEPLKFSCVLFIERIFRFNTGNQHFLEIPLAPIFRWLKTLSQSRGGKILA